MRHFILATHAYLSKGLKSSLEMIIGNQDNISYYCAYVDSNKNFKNELMEEINSYDENDEIIIMTDLFGGSVNNELLELIEKKNIYLVSGINLILVIEIIMADLNEPIEEIILNSIEDAKNGIIYCNPNKSSEVKVILDEF